MPRLSIISPCYNSASFIGRTIESVQAQTFTDWEHVIVDDGSTDASAEVAASYAARDRRIRAVRQPNGHVCNARNNGFARSSAASEYLLFLDADDMLEPHALETMLEYLDSHRQVGLAYCSLRPVDHLDQDLHVPEFGESWHVRYAPTRDGVRPLAADQPETPLSSLIASFRALPSTAFIRRSTFAATRGWDEAFRHGAEDVDLAVQLALQAPVHFVPERLVRYRRHDSNFSNSDFAHGIEQLDRKWWHHRHLDHARAQSVRDALRFARRVRCLRMLRGGHNVAHPASAAIGTGLMQLCSPVMGQPLVSLALLASDSALVPRQEPLHARLH